MKTLLFILSVLLMNSCCSVKKNEKSVDEKVTDKEKVILSFMPGPQAIIYKTKKDYSKLVPIILSEDKSVVLSFPDPKDVFYNGKLAYPTVLENDYLLDNRGINNNVAFLNISYEDYSKLENVPPVDELYTMILDKDPLSEMYNCGNRDSFENEIPDLNTLIKNNGLKDCKCLTKE